MFQDNTSNFRLVEGDLVIPHEGVEVSYYRKKPFIVDVDPHVARAIGAGRWRQCDGPGLILQEPMTDWDSALIMLPSVGPAWITYRDYSTLTLVDARVQLIAPSAR